MNGSTDRQTRSIFATWQFKFFAASVLLLLFALAKAFDLLPSLRIFSELMILPKYVMAPVIAGGVTVKNGIAEFSGNAPEMLDWTMYGSVFVSLLVVFVLLPAGYLTMRKMIHSRAVAGTPVSRLLRTASIVTAVLILLTVSLVTSGFLVSRTLFSTIRQDNAVNRYREDVMHRLAEIAFAARQHFYLPERLGGGEGRFEKNGRTIVLEDLGFSGRSPLGRFILHRGPNDTTIQVIFYGNKNIYDRSTNDEEYSRLIEYEMTVTPSRHKIVRP